MSAIRRPDALKSISAISVRSGSGLENVPLGQIRTTNGLKTFYAALAASASPAMVSGSGASRHAITVSTGYTTVTVTGASGAVSYTWASPDPEWSSNGNAISSFTRTGVEPEAGAYNTTFVCTVTDATGAMATCNVSAEVVNYGVPNGL